MTTLKAPNRWLTREIEVVVVGAGGNGSEAVDALAQFHTAMLALGHPHGLSVTILDDSIVREPNIVRQRFWPCDIGQNKAVCLANRYNMMMGLDWKGIPSRFTSSSQLFAPDIVISAVDTPSARKAISTNLAERSFAPPIWLDLGNNARNGQAILGIVGNPAYPTVFDRYPHAQDLPDDNRKSCSTAEAISSQDCLVNRIVTSAGMSIIWELLRYGETTKNCLLYTSPSPRD